MRSCTADKNNLGGTTMEKMPSCDCGQELHFEGEKVLIEDPCASIIVPSHLRCKTCKKKYRYDTYFDDRGVFRLNEIT